MELPSAEENTLRKVELSHATRRRGLNSDDLFPNLFFNFYIAGKKLFDRSIVEGILQDGSWDEIAADASLRVMARTSADMIKHPESWREKNLREFVLHAVMNEINQRYEEKTGKKYHIFTKRLFDLAKEPPSAGISFSSLGIPPYLAKDNQGVDIYGNFFMPITGKTRAPVFGHFQGLFNSDWLGRFEPAIAKYQAILQDGVFHINKNLVDFGFNLKSALKEGDSLIAEFDEIYILIATSYFSSDEDFSKALARNAGMTNLTWMHELRGQRKAFDDGHQLVIDLPRGESFEKFLLEIQELRRGGTRADSHGVNIRGIKEIEGKTYYQVADSGISDKPIANAIYISEDFTRFMRRAYGFYLNPLLEP